MRPCQRCGGWEDRQLPTRPPEPSCSRSLRSCSVGCPRSRLSSPVCMQLDRGRRGLLRKTILQLGGTVAAPADPHEPHVLGLRLQCCGTVTPKPSSAHAQPPTLSPNLPHSTSQSTRHCQVSPLQQTSTATTLALGGFIPRISSSPASRNTTLLFPIHAIWAASRCHVWHASMSIGVGARTPSGREKLHCVICSCSPQYGANTFPLLSDEGTVLHLHSR